MPQKGMRVSRLEIVLIIIIHNAVTLAEQPFLVDTAERAEQAFGHKGLVDMVMLIGLYNTTCSIINAFEVPVPEAIRDG